MATGCGDDGGGSEPTNDAGGTDDAGPPADTGVPDVDSGAPDSGGGDAGPGDAGPTDAGPQDAGGDAGNPELAQALETMGVRVDMRRAELVIGAFCAAGARCRGASVDEQQCTNQSLNEWSTGVMSGLPEACSDAILDRTSCVALLSCEQLNELNPDEPQVCVQFFEQEGQACPDV